MAHWPRLAKYRCQACVLLERFRMCGWVAQCVHSALLVRSVNLLVLCL